jgi:hypothetical protein
MREDVGIYIKGKYKSKENNKHTKEYKLWFAMLSRCYNKKYHIKEPSYKGCTVSENFKNFQFFAEWCNNQIGFNLPDWQLDKDILIKGNKIYSEDTCCFVPRSINNLFTFSNKARGDYPLGVYKDDTGRSAKLFKAACPRPEGGNQKSLGRYFTVEDAFAAYKKYKEFVIQTRAESWKEDLDPRVYQALLEYEVEITD